MIRHHLVFLACEEPHAIHMQRATVDALLDGRTFTVAEARDLRAWLQTQIATELALPGEPCHARDFCQHALATGRLSIERRAALAVLNRLAPAVPALVTLGALRDDGERITEAAA
jgi:hypothetical protein